MLARSESTQSHRKTAPGLPTGRFRSPVRFVQERYSAFAAYATSVASVASAAFAAFAALVAFSQSTHLISAMPKVAPMA